MKKVIILGGNGFIGRNLAKEVAKNGRYIVTSFDWTELDEMYRLPEVIYRKGNFFDINTLDEIACSNDIIVHAICSINPGNSNEKYLFAYKNDLLYTIELCYLCTKYKKRLVFISSGGTVYGYQTRMPIVEDTLSSPINHYGNLKLCSESTLRTFALQQKADIIIARIANVYGPGQDFTKGVGFIDAVIKRGLSKDEISVFGDGENVRDYIYVRDACKMLISLFDYRGQFNTFNLSTGEGKSQNDIIKEVSKHIPGLKTRYIEHRSVDVKEIILDNSRIKGIYHNSILNIEEGIKKYIEYLQGV
jgi:UDP-glucose 4-epimerase